MINIIPSIDLDVPVSGLRVTRLSPDVIIAQQDKISNVHEARSTFTSPPAQSVWISSSGIAAQAPAFYSIDSQVCTLPVPQTTICIIKNARVRVAVPLHPCLQQAHLPFPPAKIFRRTVVQQPHNDVLLFLYLVLRLMKARLVPSYPSLPLLEVFLLLSQFRFQIGHV